jgi:type I restriction enzyme S subunit
MENASNTPSLRFRGYTDAWGLRRFSEFTFPAGEKNKEDLPLRPFAITNDKGFVPQDEAHDEFGYMSNVDRTMYEIVKPNSFAYNPARINVGSIGYYKGAENVIVSSLYEVFQTANYVDDTFLENWFETEAFQNWIRKLQEGSVRFYFYYDKLCECEMMMPSLEEQKKIGSLLSSIDDAVVLHQRKLSKLQEIKKSLLQNMFPAEGEDRPKIRFAGYTDAWGQERLGKLAQINKGQQLGKLDMIPTGSYYVLNGGMTPSGYTDKYNTEANTISISEGGNSCGYVNLNREKYWSGGHNYTLTDLKVDTDFLFESLKAKEETIMQMRVGSGLPNIQRGSLDGFEIDIPSVEEQQKIGLFLCNIDSLLSLHQRKLEKLQQIKKALLEQMFC